MKTILILVFLFVNVQHGHAHSPQISTITLIQNKDNTWNLIVGASLSAYQYELANSYPNQRFDSVQVNLFRPLLLNHLRRNIRIKANNSKAASLQNGMVILGHQTDVRFDVKGVPEELQSIDIQQLSFYSLGGHYCLFKIITLRNGTFSHVLERENNYSVSLVLENDRFIDVAQKSGLNWQYWGLLTFGLVFIFGLIMVKKQH
jgi:hypothetical protein